jgi:hypothetical protein
MKFFQLLLILVKPSTWLRLTPFLGLDFRIASRSFCFSLCFPFFFSKKSIQAIIDFQGFMVEFVITFLPPGVTSQPVFLSEISTFSLALSVMASGILFSSS